MLLLSLWWWYYSAITTTHPSSLLILCQRNCDPAVESRIPQLFPVFHFSSQTTLKYQFPLNGYCAAKRDFKCCSSPPPHNACHSFVPSFLRPFCICLAVMRLYCLAVHWSLYRMKMDSTVILLLVLLSAGSWKVTQPVTNRDTERQTDRPSVCVGGVQMGIQIGINTIWNSIDSGLLCVLSIYSAKCCELARQIRG